jgi:hypothetical protein
MTFSEHNFRWQGTILWAFNVLVIVFKVVWQPVLEEVLAIHGVICFWISPNLKHMGEFIDHTPKE